MVQLLPIIKVVAALIAFMVKVVVGTPKNERQQSINRMSTEHQHSANNFWSSVSQLGSDSLTVIHTQPTGNLYREQRQRHGNSHSLKKSVTRVSTILGVAS